MEPTTRQRALVGQFIVNPRTSIYKAMRTAGYAHTTARQPAQIIKSESFQELLKTELADHDLIQVHKKHLHSNNEQTSLKALELAYKVKGRLTPGNNTVTSESDTYNTLIQNNQLDPNSPRGKELVDISLAAIMEATKRKT